MKEMITNWILPLMLYGGPIVPMSISGLIYRNRSKFKKIYYVILAVHLLAFIPFIACFFYENPGGMFMLIFPMGTGTLGFLISLGLLINELITKNKSNKNLHSIADSAGSE